MPRSLTGPTLRVATYNLRGLKDDALVAAEVVRAIDPDVLLLQEVPRHLGSGRVIRRFAWETGLRWTGRTRRLSGTGLMTHPRVGATRSRDTKLRVGMRENPRSYSVAHVRPAGGPWVSAVSVHLSLRGDQRVEHITTVLQEIEDDRTVPERGGLVIGGDLNENHEGRAWRIITGSLAEVSDDRPTFPSAHPRSRIDALFARGHQHVAQGDTTLLDGLDLAAATDHVPLWVDLAF